MNEDDKEKYVEQFNQNVQWLRDNIPPDDIYEFAEQALMAADYFIVQLSDWIDLTDEGNRNKVLGVWLKNVVGLRVLRDQNISGKIDTNFKSLDEI